MLLRIPPIPTGRSGENNTSILITDLIGWIESYDKLRAKATSIDLVFPGHDMSMAKDFPKVAEDVTRLV